MFLISILIVKLGMNTSDVAFFELLLFLSNFLSFAWLMGFKNGFLSYFPALDFRSQKELVFNIAVLFIALALIAALFLFGFRTEIVALVTQYDFVPYVPLICVYLFFSAPTILTEFIYLVNDRPGSLMKYGTLIYTTQVLLVSIAWISFQTLEAVIMAIVLWSILKFVWFVIVVSKYSKFRMNLSLQRKFIIFSTPLVLHILLGNGMEYIDGFLVAKFFEQDEFAVFRYGARELPLATLLVGALVSALIPASVKEMDQTLEKVKRKSLNLMRWIFPLTAVLILLSPILYPLVYSMEYKYSSLLFNIYLLIISSRILLPQIMIFGMHKNQVLVYSAMIELIINLCLSLLLMQYWGLAGIAIATVIAYLVNKLILIGYNYFSLKIPISRYLDLKSYLGYNLLLVLVFFISLLY